MKYLFSILIFYFLSFGFLQAQHLKKDGTPDMRYKENRSIYARPAAPSYSAPYKAGSHLKRDGTPDKRYQKNNTKNNINVKRDKNGKIIRSQAAINRFKKLTGYPHGRPGYIIDHIIPLKDGGCDCPENMQWQTLDDAMAKDKWE